MLTCGPTNDCYSSPTNPTKTPQGLLILNLNFILFTDNVARLFCFNEGTCENSIVMANVGTTGHSAPLFDYRRTKRTH